MVGPAGIECEHSIKVKHPKTGKMMIPNNHWCKSSNGVVACRGGGYAENFEIGSQDDYSSSKLLPPPLTTITNGKTDNLLINSSMINDDWETVIIDELMLQLN